MVLRASSAGERPPTRPCPQTRHPLQRYSLVNRRRVPAPKSVVRPEFVHSSGIHTSQGLPGVNGTVPEPGCLCVLHLQRLLHARDAHSMSRTVMRCVGYLFTCTFSPYKSYAYLSMP